MWILRSSSVLLCLFLLAVTARFPLVEAVERVGGWQSKAAMCASGGVVLDDGAPTTEQEEDPDSEARFALEYKAESDSMRRTESGYLRRDPRFAVEPVLTPVAYPRSAWGVNRPLPSAPWMEA